MKFLCLALLLLFSPRVFAQSMYPPGRTDYLWRQAMEGAVIGQPSVRDQSVAAVLDSGSIKTYSAGGKPLWTFSAQGRLCPYITRSREGTSYICRTNGILIAVNRQGRELWRVSVGGALSGPVVLGWDGRVFVPAARKIICYTVTGNRLWEMKLPAAVNAGPLLDNSGGMVLALENGDVMRISPFCAVRVWHLPKSPRVVVPIDGGKPAILALHDDGSVQRIDAAVSGSTPSDCGLLPSPPLAAAGRGANAAAALANGQMVLLSGADGHLLWTADTHVRVLRERGEAVSESTAVVLYNERGIYMLSASGATCLNIDGKRQWFTTLKNASGIPALGDDGILYSGGVDWILYAWKLEDLQARSGHKPNGSYGLGFPPFPGTADPLDQFDESYLQHKLKTVRREIAAGRVGEREPEWFAWLMEVAQGGSRPAIFPSSRPLVPVTQRIQALQLLAIIGSNEAVPWLAAFFRKETEPLVKAAAAQAIGGIGTDPGGRALQAFLAAATTGHPAREEQVFAAVAAAAGSVCLFSGPQSLYTGMQVLFLLIQPGQSPFVQRAARRELDRLKME